MSIPPKFTEVRRGSREFPRPKQWFLGISLLWMIGWTILQIRRYSQGHATVFDLGSTAQSLYLISHGHWLAYNSFLNKPTLLDIDAYVLYLLAWPFRFLGGPYFLFGLQSFCWLGFAVTTYEYMFERSHHTLWTAWIFGCLALLSPSLIGALMFDFHVDFVALLGLSLALRSCIRNKPGVFYAGILLALLSKNVVAIPVVTWAMIEIVAPRSFTRKTWVIVFVLASGIFLFDEVALPRIFGLTVASHLSLFSQYGSSAPAILQTLLWHPALIFDAVWIHRLYLGAVAGPWGFLPFVSGLYLLPFMSLVVLNDLANDPAIRSLATQYSVIITFFGLLAAGRHASFRTVRQSILWIISGTSGLLLSLILDHGLWATEIHPQITSNPSMGDEVHLAHIINDQRGIAIWTTNHLGVLVYRHRLIEEDTAQNIEELWKQRRLHRPGSPILLFLPRGNANLEINAIVWHALTHHYKMTTWNTAGIILSGHNTFPAYPALANAAQVAEDRFAPTWPEYFPVALTLGGGRMNPQGWRTSAQAGMLSTGLPTALPSGRYTLHFVLSTPTSHQVLGVVRLINAQNHHTLLSTELDGNSHGILLNWRNAKNQWVIPQVVLDGQGLVRYFGVIIQKK